MFLCKQMAWEDFCMLLMVLAFCMMDAFSLIPQFKQCRPVFCYHYLLHCTSVNYQMEIKKYGDFYTVFSHSLQIPLYSTKPKRDFSSKTKWQIDI